jgi:effector-binding domain-containing protein
MSGIVCKMELSTIYFEKQELLMDIQVDVKIVTLPPMRVASQTAYGPSPEIEAYQGLIAWAQENQVLTYPDGQRIFGFNNPGPTPGSPNYGYEFWMTVPAGTSGSERVEIKDIPGRTYAVIHCESLPVIGERWRQLINWVQTSGYRAAAGECLEEYLGPLELIEEQLIFDLYQPIND